MPTDSAELAKRLRRQCIAATSVSRVVVSKPFAMAIAAALESQPTLEQMMDAFCRHSDSGAGFWLGRIGFVNAVSDLLHPSPTPPEPAMKASDKCPKCGAAFRSTHDWKFRRFAECESRIAVEGSTDASEHTQTCRILQLEAEVASLKKRLQDSEERSILDM